MPSLTSFLPHLPNFGLSVPALYERQRALVRLGHLPAPIGRGRGSGAQATPRNVAILIIAVMATDNLSDTDARIKRLASAKADPEVWKNGCDLTGARSFSEALALVLGSAELSKSVQSVVVSRSNLSAELFHRVPKKQHYVIATRFGPDYPREFDVVCHMSGDMVRYLHDMLKQFGAIL